MNILRTGVLIAGVALIFLACGRNGTRTGTFKIPLHAYHDGHRNNNRDDIHASKYRDVRWDVWRR